MAARIERCQVGPFEAFVLETDSLRAVVLPSLGARVWELEDKIRRRQWIWNQGIANLRTQLVGANYDEVWAGGWEELFPNDAAGAFEGRELPDHGEWWATAWSVVEKVGGLEPRLTLTARMSVVRATCTKEFRLSADGTMLVIRYRIRSEERQPFHFLFKQHLPIKIAPECMLQLSGGAVRAVDPSFGTIVTNAEEFAWPHAPTKGRCADLRQIPAKPGRHQEFLYVRNLPGPWCGVDDMKCRASIRMCFESEVLPYVWLFLTYGGWRGYYTAVLEPCTNCPKDLSEAVRLGQSARLEHGQEFATQVSVRLSPLVPNPQVMPHNRKIGFVPVGDAI
jgi:hypothetical protein